jgi:phosphatidylglycerol lysyltransferase
MKRKWIHGLGTALSFCLFVAALAIIHHRLRNTHYRDIVDQMRQVGIVPVLAAIFLTALNYLALTAYDALGLRYIGRRLPYRKLAVASFIGYVFGNSATIVGGSAARYSIYSSFGVSAGDVAKLVIFCALTFWLGLLAVSGFAFIIEPTHVPDALHQFLPGGSLQVIGVALLVVVAAYMLLIAGRRRPLNMFGWELQIPSIWISAGQIVISAVDWLLAAWVFYVLLPQGIHVGFRQYLVMFVLAQGAGLVSHVPGGLGVFETICLLMLGSDSSYPESLPALTASFLMYRLIYYVLPLILASILLAAHEVLFRRAIVLRWGSSLGRWGSVMAPHLLALTTFVSGMILLFSGALPAVRGRMVLLRDFLPLPAVEASHFLGSLVGAALLILARGLQRRLDAAYHITLVLLSAGVALSLLKGLAYEEAVILTVMLITLIPCRSYFYRRASLISDRFTPGWIALALIVVLASVWLAYFSRRHYVLYTNDLWWQFAFEKDAPRSLRASAGAVILVLLFALARLLVPSRPKAIAPDAAGTAAIGSLVAASPRTYAWLALVPDKQFILGDKKEAFIMYAMEGRSWVAMGDPVGSQNRGRDLAWRFVELCAQYDGLPAFYQVEAQHLDLYADLGMAPLKLGEEAYVHLPSFSLDGGQRSNLRHAHNKVARIEPTFRIIPPVGVPAIEQDLRRVSDAWLAEKNTREKGFSLGYFTMDYLSRCPMAVVESGGRIVAFTNLWLGAEKEELSADLMRYQPNCPDGIMDYLFIETMLWGKNEGYRWFNLGMAPLSGLEDHASAPLWSKAGMLIFRYGEHFYNFQGVRLYKEKFNPQWRPKYLACRGGLALPRAISSIATLTSRGLTGVVAK